MTASSTWWAFTAFLALSGLGLSPYITNSILIFNESSGAKMRAQASVIINSFWTIGQILAGLLAYLLNNNWKGLVLVGMSIPLTLLMPLIVIWSRESPMFLASKRKFQDAKEVLRGIAHTNNRELPNFYFTEERRLGSNEKKAYGFIDLLRFKSLRSTTLIGSFLCFSIYFNYYGTIFALTSVQVNSYVLTIILAVAELFAYYMSGVMAQKLSRRFSFALCSTICCVANLLFMIFPVPKHCASESDTCYQVYMQLILSTINRFAVAIAMALSGIYVSEIFPTPVRAIGSGLIVFIARLGSFVATLAISFCLKSQVNPILAFGALCFPAIIASLMAKETQGLPLPESIEEEREDDLESPGLPLIKILHKKNNNPKLKLNENVSESTATSPGLEADTRLELEDDD